MAEIKGICNEKFIRARETLAKNLAIGADFHIGAREEDDYRVSNMISVSADSPARR